MPTKALIHIIDDNFAVRDSLLLLLRASGFKVQAHRAGSDFLGAMPLENVGCVITDIRMPGVSIIDVLGRLRDGGLDVPVTIIIGHGDARRHRTCRCVRASVLKSNRSTSGPSNLDFSQVVGAISDAD